MTIIITIIITMFTIITNFNIVTITPTYWYYYHYYYYYYHMADVAGLSVTVNPRDNIDNY